MTYQIKFKHYTGEFTLHRAHYGNGTLAVIAVDKEGGEEVLSINLQAYAYVPANDNEFFVKNYSEHAGLPKALVDAGIANFVSPVPVRAGFGEFYLMRLADGVQFINQY